jgi:hypothetical protein
VDTAARELEIEKKLKEFQITNTETSVDTEEKKPSSWSSYNRGKRSSQNDDHRDRRDDGNIEIFLSNKFKILSLS